MITSEAHITTTKTCEHLWVFRFLQWHERGIYSSGI